MPRKPAYIASEMLPMSALVGRLAALRHEWQSAIARRAPGYEQGDKQRNYERVKAIYDARVAAGESPQPMAGLASLNRVRAAEAACDQALRDLHSEFTQGYRFARGHAMLVIAGVKNGKPASPDEVKRLFAPMARALRDAAITFEARVQMLHETLTGTFPTAGPGLPPGTDSTATPSPHPTAEEDPSVPPPPEPDMDDYFDSIEPPPTPNTHT